MEKGIKEDGSMKLRPVDDLSASSVNASCRAHEKLHHDGVDSLFMLVRMMVIMGVSGIGLITADIDAAFRRCG